MLAHLARFEPSIHKWLLAALLIAIPVYPKFPLFNLPGIYVAVRAEDFLILALSVFTFFKVLQNPKVFFKDRINQAFFLFFIAGFIALLSGIFLTHTVVPHVGLLHLARRIEYVMPFMMAAILTRPEYPRFFVQILVVVSIVVSLYAFGQMYLEFPVISTQNYEFSKGLALQWVPGARLHSTFAGHYDLAAFLVIILPIFWALFFATKTIAERIYIFIGIASSFWLLVTASSRISISAYFAGVGITLWLLNKRLFIIPVFAISIILMLAMGDLSQRYKYSFDTIRTQIPLIKEKIMLLINQKKESFLPQPVFAQEEERKFTAPIRHFSATPEPEGPPVIEDRSTSIRLNVEWPRALRSLFKNPLLGTGYSSITLATDNDYLRLLGEVGVLGFMAFLLVMVRIWKRLWRFIISTQKITEEKAFVVGSVGVFAGILVNALFIDVFEASKVALVFWAILGISVAIAGKKGTV